MYTELTYLLEELKKENPNKPLTVGLLIKHIEKSMNKASSDQHTIEESFDPAWH